MSPLLLLAVFQVSSGPAPIHDARSGETEVAVPRLDEEAVADGLLDEPAWSLAAVLTGFSQFSPQDGVDANDSTHVRIWYSDEALYVGVQAYAPAGTVRATLADRDRIDSDDQVQILLDTFDDGRRAMVFGVNPFGIQLDGVRVEERSSVGWFGTAGEEHPLDRNPDFVYQSVGRLTATGFDVELRIPFKSLRYQSSEVQSWGINVVRVVQATGHTHTWTRARRGRASFLAQSGRLTGLAGFDRGLVLDVTPVVTARLDGSAGESGGWDYARGGPEYGGSLRWGATDNLTLNGTINPDFSQVEADAGQIIYDPRNAIAFPDKRPFFLEASERFQVPSRLVYTRQIVRPDLATKLSGTAGRTGLGVLLAVDDRSTSLTGSRPRFGIVRLTRDFGASSTLGLVYTDRSERDAYNRVAGLDALLVRGSYTLSLQGAGSWDRIEDVDQRGHLWDVALDRSGRHFGASVQFRGTSPDFVTRTGFLARAGTATVSARPRLTWYGESGARVETYGLGINLSGSWLHDRFWEGGDPEDAKLALNGSMTLRGGWQFGSSLLVERFWYPEYLYADYALETSGVAGVPDTVPFVGTPTLDNLDLVMSVATPTWSTFGANVFVIVGRDENFDEWGPANIVIGDASIDWRPTEQVRVSPTYVRQQYTRPGDGSTVRVRDIPRLKIEYQLTRSIFFRGVMQYDATWRDALRDDTRTDAPILVRNAATGVYERTSEVRTNRVQGDLLFSYEPSPGTVFFLGYGSAMTEADRFRFRDLDRSRDGFFVKASYLFRR